MAKLQESREDAAPAIVLFFVDGLAQSVLDRSLAAGELPTIQQRFVAQGVELRDVVTSLPPLTYANIPSLLTGLYPARHGILGHQWFDPLLLVSADYGTALTYRDVDADFAGQTLYEILSDRFTLNVQCHTRRGATHTIDQDVSSGILWGLRRFSDVDARVAGVLPRVARLIEQEARWPSVWMNYFPGVDEVGHRYGPDSPQYAAALRTVDEAIGRILRFVDERAGDRPMYRALLTDHGMVGSPPEKRVDAIGWLRNECGLRVLANGEVGNNARRLRTKLEGADVVAFTGSHRRLAIHVRPAAGWGTHATPDDVDHYLFRRIALGGEPLWAFPSVEVVMTREADGVVCIHSREGTKRIKRVVRTPSEYCALLENGEPLMRDPEDSDTWSSADTCLMYTEGSQHPDWVVQTCEMMQSPRAGDIVAFAADDWSFDPHAAGGHGSLRRDDMCVSWYFAGGDLPRSGFVLEARTVDLMPTVLDLLGEYDRLKKLPQLDGDSLAGLLREPYKAGPERLGAD